MGEISRRYLSSTRKAAYALFLKTPFWQALSLSTRACHPFCAICGIPSSEAILHAHHHHYPANWFHTATADLTVLCEHCHRRLHRRRAR